MNARRPFPPRWRDRREFPVTTLPEVTVVPDLISGHEDPPPSYIVRQAPANMQWVKQYNFSSEFNTESARERVPMDQLDRWTTDNHWQGRFPAVFDKNNVTYDGRSMVLRARQHNTPTSGFLAEFGESHRREIEERMRTDRRFYTGSFVRSKEEITYGYFEAVVKLGDSGLSSAFWLKERGGREREIDVFEYSTSTNLDGSRRLPLANQFLMNVHTFERRRGNQKTDHKNEKSVVLDQDLSRQQYIKTGLLWTKDKVCWYLNDTLVREFDHGGEFRNAKMRVQFDREYFKWIGDPLRNDPFDDFEVMYIRTWQL
ncbi:Glycoside hydrolase 16 [Gracilaria domingensis]|nr:Glycoside hydrolase 16 [Gracilaria domingensis]